MLFSKVKLTLNCFQKWFSGIYKIIELEDAKSLSLRTHNMFRKSFFFCHAIKFDLLSTVFSIYGHRIFSGIRKSKYIFFELNFKKNDFFRK